MVFPKEDNFYQYFINIPSTVGELLKEFPKNHLSSRYKFVTGVDNQA